MKHLFGFVSVLLVILMLCMSCGAETLQADKQTEYFTGEMSYKNLKAGDTLYFGTYEQDRDSSTRDKLEWKVLTVKGDKALIITTKIIKNDSYFNPYWIKYKYTYWAKSYIGSASSVNYRGSSAESAATRITGISPSHVPLANGKWGKESDLYYTHARYWLNNTFYKSAFSTSERSRIVAVTNSNPDNPSYGTDGGPNSEDRIFFLSYDEMLKYMPNKSDRKCQMTRAAKKESGNSDLIWWLRTPGKYRTNAMYVSGKSGSCSTAGSDVGHNSVGYRPCLWIRIK